MQTKAATGVNGIRVIRVYYPALMHPRPPQLRERRNVLGLGLSSLLTSSAPGPYLCHYAIKHSNFRTGKPVFFLL